MRILLVENFKDLFGVGVVFRKNNGFSELLPVVDLLSVCHQDMKQFFYGVLIENPFIEC